MVWSTLPILFTNVDFQNMTSTSIFAPSYLGDGADSTFQWRQDNLEKIEILSFSNFTHLLHTFIKPYRCLRPNTSSGR